MESLEFVALLPCLTIIVFALWQALTIARLGSEAQADARTLARIVALCPKTEPPPITKVDPAATSGIVKVEDLDQSLVQVTVEFPVPAAPGGIDLSALGPIRARVSMRREPCA